MKNHNKINSLLIIGGSSFLGGNLISVIASGIDTYFTYHTNKINCKNQGNTFQLDIKNKEDVKRLICKISPQIVVHTAAKTSIAFCEKNKKEAWETNVIGTKNIAQAVEQIKAKLIYLSTDLVFDGSKMFYTEKDIPNPICYYGRTKFEGEKIVSTLCSDYIIARTSLIYGKSVNSSKCSTDILINDLMNNNIANLFYDEYRTPLYIKDLCKILLEFAERKNTHDIFNLCGSERLSRYQFGLKIADIFNLNNQNITKVSSSNNIYNKYNRPKDSSLSNLKLNEVSDVNILKIEEGLKDMLSIYNY